MDYETWDQYRAREEARERDEERKKTKGTRCFYPAGLPEWVEGTDPGDELIDLMM